MSIDCCTYKCNQGRDCPVRSTPLPNVATVAMPTTSHARKYTCQDMPTPTQAVGDYDAGEELSPAEAIFLYSCIGISGVLTIAVAGGVLGWIYSNWGG
jgi:hypothetical protein